MGNNVRQLGIHEALLGIDQMIILLLASNYYDEQLKRYEVCVITYLVAGESVNLINYPNTKCI